MGIEPTRDASQRPTLDLKSRRATSALSTSAVHPSITISLKCVEEVFPAAGFPSIAARSDLLLESIHDKILDGNSS